MLWKYEHNCSSPSEFCTCYFILCSFLKIWTLGSEQLASAPVSVTAAYIFLSTDLASETSGPFKQLWLHFLFDFSHQSPLGFPAKSWFKQRPAPHQYSLLPWTVMMLQGYLWSCAPLQCICGPETNIPKSGWEALTSLGIKVLWH